MIIETNEQLQHLTNHFKTRLQLSDWHIKVNFGAERDMKADGEIFMDIVRREAFITIMKAEDLQQRDSIRPHNMLQILIHELLHIPLKPLYKFFGPNGKTNQDDEDLYEYLEETAINQIAWALTYEYEAQIKE